MRQLVALDRAATLLHNNALAMGERQIYAVQTNKTDGTLYLQYFYLTRFIKAGALNYLPIIIGKNADH
jgi:uncharacterized membrane protein